MGLARRWAEALGWVAVNDAEDAYEIRPAPDGLPGLLSGPVQEAKTVTNRLHLKEPWVVLIDPEGNEFCVRGERRA
ncbi:hypothetical protein [Streptomyces roseochromogenus]|uniref:Glyoxalase-like domain-containing protein n=1 Tax=Streptomyces roseochromogenus subsp. oscitans DS 12.976 TaxID=1352936 RepID=V6JKY7_STRRC|nr:hypothetical protein [Streptomyces roseochromogenus]EST19756.1 hypothetical protein M878_41305 [Streptomyces roseochromogenus subsp. oscitans DS 12.976]